MRPAIAVERVSKCYRVPAGADRLPYRTLRDDLMAALAAPLRRFRRPPPRDLFWAMKDVSFEVPVGDVVGIIGRNGAGKSTLLKILSRVTRPTSGLVRLRGRVGSLLEVGTGFHPELTGRDNVYLSGAVLGMRKTEIRRKFDEIVAFAEVEKFLDLPVKRYSSGMYTRLAFAVAAHLEPEILVVDEVLAVGDATFQKKCLGKMGDAAKGGRTVLLVSHNMLAVNGLCRRAVWLDQGSVRRDGPAAEVTAAYLQAGAGLTRERSWPDDATAPGNDQVRLHRATARPVRPGGTDTLTIRDPVLLEFEYSNFVEGAVLNLTLLLYTAEGVCVLTQATAAVPHAVGRHRGRFELPGDLLNDGAYHVKLMFVRDASIAITATDEILRFELEELVRDVPWFGKWIGVVRPPLRTEIGPIDAVHP